MTSSNRFKANKDNTEKSRMCVDILSPTISLRTHPLNTQERLEAFV